MNINNAIEKPLENNNKDLWGILKSKFNNDEKRIRVLYRWSDIDKQHMLFAMYQYEDDATYKEYSTFNRGKVLATGLITYVPNNCGLAFGYNFQTTPETAELAIELCSHMCVGGIIYTLTNGQPKLKKSLVDAGFKYQGLDIRNPNTYNLLDILVFDYEVPERK